MRNIVKCLLLLGIIFANLQFANAEQFQHNLLKMDVYKTSLGGVKVTLYTNKPYSDNIVVNKKTDNEYVILMPETLNSMTAKPALSKVSDVIKDINVKTQQYNAQGKGYTKITFSTAKPVEITSQVQTLNTGGYQINDKDYKELLNQVSKKTAETKKSTVKNEKPKTPAPRPLSRPIIKPTVKAVTKTIAKSEKPNKIVVKTVKKQTEKITSPPISKQTAKPVTKVITKPEPKQESTQVATPIAPIAPTSVEPTKTENKAIEQQPVPPTSAQVSSPIIGKFEQYKQIIKNNIYTALGLAIAAFIILLLGARRMLRGTHANKKIFTENLNEQPQTQTDYAENITEDMTWKEKFQAQSEQDSLAEDQVSIDESTELNHLFAEDNEEFVDESSTQLPQAETFSTESSILDEFINQQELYEPSTLKTFFPTKTKKMTFRLKLRTIFRLSLTKQKMNQNS